MFLPCKSDKIKNLSKFLTQITEYKWLTSKIKNVPNAFFHLPNLPQTIKSRKTFKLNPIT